MLLLCCNLLSLPDGGSTTEWPGGFHLLHLPSFCVIMRHTYATEFGTVMPSKQKETQKESMG